MNWFNTLNPNLQAALVAATVTLFGIFLKDFLLTLWNERRRDEKDSLAIFQKYADPLSSAATSLLWRLKEVFAEEGRGLFLKQDSPPNTYNHYKKLSTLYRLASLVGWIRAFRRELSYLKVRDKEGFHSIQNALDNFESALADGPQVELERLEGLARIWDLTLPEDEPQKAALAVEVEQVMDKQFHNESIDGQTDIPPNVKLRLSNALATVLCNRLKMKLLSQDVLEETKSRCYEVLTIKEAWLYRDWQAGIGDLMINDVSGSARRFDVIGFKAFESMCISGEEQQKMWLRRLNEIIDDVDVSKPSDCRVKQLRQTYQATAKLIIALANIDTGYKTISQATVSAAKQVSIGHRN